MPTSPRTLTAAADAILRYVESSGRRRLGVTVDQMLWAGRIDGALRPFDEHALHQAVELLTRLGVLRLEPWGASGQRTS